MQRAGAHWAAHDMCCPTANQLRHRVHRHLLAALRNGIEVDRGGCVHVRIWRDIFAVVAPRDMGGWEVVTFYRPGVVVEDEPEEAVQ